MIIAAALKCGAHTLDWNAQANGCYLTAGAVLCPTATTQNPQDEKDWIAVEYLGVPPGTNARLAVLQCVGGNLKELYREGWPDKQRTGRKIDRQTIRLLLDGHSIRVFENGQLCIPASQISLPSNPCTGVPPTCTCSKAAIAITRNVRCIFRMSRRGRFRLAE